jgi:hypothetical protein
MAADKETYYVIKKGIKYLIDPATNKFGALRNAMPIEVAASAQDIVEARGRKGEVAVKVTAEMVYQDLGPVKGKGRGRPPKAKK